MSFARLILLLEALSVSACMTSVAPGTRPIILDASYTRNTFEAGSVVFPKGVYQPTFQTRGGVYYEAPTVLISAGNSTSAWVYGKAYANPGRIKRSVPVSVGGKDISIFVSYYPLLPTRHQGRLGGRWWLVDGGIPKAIPEVAIRVPQQLARHIPEVCLPDPAGGHPGGVFPMSIN